MCGTHSLYLPSLMSDRKASTGTDLGMGYSIAIAASPDAVSRTHDSFI